VGLSPGRDPATGSGLCFGSLGVLEAPPNQGLQSTAQGDPWATTPSPGLPFTCTPRKRAALLVPLTTYMA
jgi:hypothetical protein